ncbi:MAG TPA: MFS transporter [Dehalococcoidia bacterium]|nr:MFS transporter [Dehalococcoidia bacterium]
MELQQTTAALRARGANLFYGWWIVAAGFVNQALAAALIQRSYGTYVAVLREEFGWSKAALSGAFSMQQIENGMLGPAQGWLIDRFGPRLSMRLGTSMLGIGFMAFSQINSLTGFYVAYLCMAVGVSLGGFFPFTVVIVNWFDRRRARALSTFQMGGAVGGLLVTAVAFALETFGWRTTAFASGMAILAIGLPLIQIVHQKPEDLGLRVEGDDSPEADDTNAGTDVSVPGRVDFTVRQAMRTRAFWLVSFGHGSALLIVSAVNVHLVLHLTEDLGYSLALASFVVTVVQASQIGGTFIGGLIGDRLDKRYISMSCMAAHTVGLLLVALAVNAVMVFAFAILHGMAWGLRGPMMQAIRADYFGRTSYGAILGMSSLITMFGSILGPIVAGYLADKTGSYEEGFIILALLSGLGSVFFLLARRPDPPVVETQVQPSAVA